MFGQVEFFRKLAHFAIDLSSLRFWSTWWGLPAGYTVDEIAVNRKVEKKCVLYQVVEPESKIIVG